MQVALSHPTGPVFDDQHRTPKHLDTNAQRAKHSTHQLPRTPKQKKTAPAKHQSEAEAFHYYRARRRDLAEDGSHVTSAVERGT